MKKYIYSIAALCAATMLSGCDNFLELDPLDKVPGDRLTETDGGVMALLANVYSAVPMEDFAFVPDNHGFNYRDFDGTRNSSSISMITDDAARSDGGYGLTETFDYWPYSDIRQVNIFIQTIEDSRDKGLLSEKNAARLIAEARFARAYIYYGLVKRYGGVPIIDRVQDGDYQPGNSEALKVPRSTELATWRFIIDEFGAAAADLPTQKDGYRFTKWAALGMKSRVALHAASLAKYWNRAPLAGEAVNQKLVGMSESDAAAFYSDCISASEDIIANSGKSLYRPNPADADAAAENYQKIFLDDPDEEVILARGYVDGSLISNQGHGYSLFYSPSQANPGVLYYGRFSPMLDLVDTYEDYTDDGTGASAPIKTRTDGNETNLANVATQASAVESAPFIKYNAILEPFENKDARLRATVILPGADYAGVKILMQGGLIDASGKAFIYQNQKAQGKDGNTYFGFGAEGASSYSGFGNIGDTQNGNFTTSGFSVRKYMEEFKFSSLKSQNNSVTTPFIDIRYAEILLNYAEAVVESGSGDAAKAAKYLNDIRHRAAHKDNIPLTLANVLKERRVELALEGQRNWDMVRLRIKHQYFNSGMRSVLVPMVDLREATPKYIFVRANFHGDEKTNGRTFNPQEYYRAIPGTATNGLVQNPGY